MRKFGITLFTTFAQILAVILIIGLVIGFFYIFYLLLIFVGGLCQDMTGTQIIITVITVIVLIIIGSVFNHNWVDYKEDDKFIDRFF